MSALPEGSHYPSFKVTPKSKLHARCNDILLRLGEKAQLVFRPQLVKSDVDERHSIDGDFIWQRKKKEEGWDDVWEDETFKRLTDLKPGEGVKLHIKTEELYRLMQMLPTLYAYYSENGIPQHSATVPILANASESLDSDIESLLHQAKAAGKAKDLAALLKAALAWEDTGVLAEAIADLGPSKLKDLNALAGLATLRSALALWEKQKANHVEEFWQQTLAKQSFVLSQVFSAPVVVFKERAYVGGKDINNSGGKYPDLLLQNTVTGSVLIVEIKTPATRLLGPVYRKPDVYNISENLTGAVQQASAYKDTFLKNYHTMRSQSGQCYRAANPRCLVIAGNSQIEFANEDPQVTKWKNDSFELFRNGLRDVEVLTFDELFQKTETLVKLLENTPTTQADDDF